MLRWRLWLPQSRLAFLTSHDANYIFYLLDFFVLNVVVLRIPEYSNCSSFNFQYFTTVIFFTITLKKKKNDI